MASFPNDNLEDLQCLEIYIHMYICMYVCVCVCVCVCIYIYAFSYIPLDMGEKIQNTPIARYNLNLPWPHKEFIYTS